MEAPGQVMLNDQKQSRNYIDSLQQLSENIDLGPEKSRNLAYALGDLSKIVDEKAKEINTELKYIIVVTNGPFTDTGNDDAELASMKEQLRQRNIKLYILQLGSSYQTCQLQRITQSNKVIVVHYVNQLVYGGKAKQSDDETKTQKRSNVPIEGALVVLQKKLMRDARTLEPKLGRITYFENNDFNPWNSRV
ncbi:hypothetical protein RF11_07124 [Thelohanellus kitauei]|uniref:VWFA domain-containing protein n=1 Tax=Thelohanellus kitauei TaxID=669202 RepID=A0A0C2IXE1_THEKT|nr:hypothetical protein RF11_07124 [Thelohanellus kitauei]